MTKFKGLNPSFSPRIIPIIQGFDMEQVENMQFPLFIQGVPKGLQIFIRSGFIQTMDSRKVINLNFKEKFKDLINYTKKLKVTVEAIVHTSTNTNVFKLREALFGYDEDVSDISITILDKVFEHSPYFLDFKTRNKGFEQVFIPSKIGIFPKIAENAQINSKQEFIHVVSSMYTLGYRNFRIISPSSKYKFGELEDLFKEGGIAELRCDTSHKGELVEIVPEINKNKETSFYSASELKVRFERQVITVPLAENSVILKTKIWENKQNLIGKVVIFSGAMLPGYTVPTYRKFIRFDKII